jgi:hypothetical protein
VTDAEIDLVRAAYERQQGTTISLLVADPTFGPVFVRRDMIEFIVTRMRPSGW